MPAQIILFFEANEILGRYASISASVSKESRSGGGGAPASAKAQSSCTHKGLFVLPAQSRGVHSQSERELLFLISVLFSVLEQAPHIAFVHIVRVREVACVRKLLAVYALVTVSEHHFQILL